MTRNGIVLACTTVVLLLAGAWTGYPELVKLGYAGVGALVLAVGWLFASPQVTVTREIRPQRVFEGSEARGLLTVTNVGRRRTPSLSFTETVGAQRVTMPLPALAAGQEHQVGYPLPTSKRGRYVVPPLVLGNSDPLRLLQRRRAVGAGTVLHVYPRVHPLALLTTGGPHDSEGSTASSAPMGGVAFHSLREYQPEDDWRLIHWGATARAGTLMARHLVIPDEPRQLVVLDTSAAPYAGGLFEDAVRLAASFCVAAEEAKLPTQLRTTGGATGGRPLDLLSVVDRSTTDRGLAALPDIVRDIVSAERGVALVVITGRVTAGHAELLARARPRFLSVGLAQLTAAQPAPVAAPGVLAVTASSSADFASSWNRLVLR